MHNTYDTIIIGGGIAGLLTALRLSLNGQRILVIEKDRIGSGSTMSNHGMVHSGALYVKQHGHIVRFCQEAQAAFTELFSEAEFPCEASVYIASKQQIKEFSSLLDRYEYHYQELSLIDVPEVNKAIEEEYRMIALKERVFSSAIILRRLAEYCQAQGVHFLTGVKIQHITYQHGAVTGVIIGQGEHLTAASVVIAAGLGTTQVLQTFQSQFLPDLKSRLDMMTHLPHASIKRGLIFADLDKPILMPAKQQSALGSYFGGIQPLIHGDRKFAVDFAKAQQLMDMMKRYFSRELVNTDDAQFYMCGKTDYTGHVTTEKGFINPSFHVIDHMEKDEIAGLYTIITGKMTLAFHASRTAASKILKQDLPLVIPLQKTSAIASHMMTVEPWSNVQDM